MGSLNPLLADKTAIDADFYMHGASCHRHSPRYILRSVCGIIKLWCQCAATAVSCRSSMHIAAIAWGLHSRLPALRQSSASAHCPVIDVPLKEILIVNLLETYWPRLDVPMNEIVYALSLRNIVNEDVLFVVFITPLSLRTSRDIMSNILE